MERNAYFDNAKLCLIFLVVFGHMIQPFIHDSTSVKTLYTWIYTFHMPAFIFLAGFFAKGSGNIKYIVNLAKKLLFPYIIFQLIYSGYYFLIGKPNWFTEHIFYPHWSLWFLVSLFCWHIILIIYKRIPPIWGITLALIVGIMIGYFDNVEHTFSLSRTFVFFPFFLIGYWTDMKYVEQLKRRWIKVTSALVLIAMALAIYYLPDINYGWFLASKSYDTLGLERLGGLARITVYMTAALMATAVLTWIPKQRFSFTVLGERTLYVYLLHGFFIQYFRQYDILTLSSFTDLIVIIVISLLIVIILASKVSISIWQPLIELNSSRLRKYVRQFR